MTEEQESSVYEEQADSEAAQLKKELAEARAKAESNLAGWQRAQADYINFKRRSEQEREETVKFANAMLVLKLLPALDDFERAFARIPDSIKDDPWVEGIRLIERKLRSILEAEGLSPIEAVGQPFDPRVHEAVRQLPGKEGIVIEEAEKGYKFKDRVIRPTKVAVGTGEAEQQVDDEET